MTYAQEAQKLIDDLFAGCVHIDKARGYAGTDFPTGTAVKPVNNLADAQAIAMARGFQIPEDVVDVLGRLAEEYHEP